MMTTKQMVSIVFLGISLIFGANAMDQDRGGNKKSTVSADRNPVAGTTMKGRKKGGYGPAADAFKARNAMALANKELAQRGFLAPANLSNGNALLQTNETAAGALQTLSPPAGEALHVLHFNLCWECMARSPVGSGNVASIHCNPGSDSKVSTCSENVLTNVGEWQTETGFDIVTFAELGSPQKNTDATRLWNLPRGDGDARAWQGGFDTSGKDNRDAVQTSITFYTKLQEKFPKHIFILNKQPVSRFGRQSYDHSLTLYNPDTFRLYERPIELKTSLTPGRLLTALIFKGRAAMPNSSEVPQAKGKKVLVVNMHSIHFRKHLINPTKATKDPTKAEPNDLIGKFQPKGHYDPTGLMEFAGQYAKLGRNSTQGPGCVECTKDDAMNGGNCFSIKKCPTTCLATIYGGFIQQRITQAARKAGAAQAIEGIKRVIMSGDFNDETGELISFNVFGKNVRIDAGKRKRTCCSDRDSRWLLAAKQKVNSPSTANTAWISTLSAQEKISWKKAFNREDAGLLNFSPIDYSKYANCDAGDMTDAYPDHAEANWDYMESSCKYGTKQEIKKLILTGTDKAARIDDQSRGGQHYSRYPFASDLVLDSEGVTKLDFPKGYVQNLGKGTMSDHDPIVATLKPL